MSILKRLNAAMSPAAMLVAILALVVSAAGAGYAAGQIGTSGIKNNAITAKKIKKNAVTGKKIKNGAVTGAKVADRSLTNADLVSELPFVKVAGHNGGEGDCVWSEGSSEIPGIAPSGYRKTRSGLVVINALMGWSDEPGGDTECGGPDIADALEDLTMFTLPSGYRPPKPIYRIYDDHIIVIGAQSASSLMGTPIPAGAVIWSDTTGDTSGTANLDLTFTAAGSPGAAATATRAAHAGPLARDLARKLLGQN